MSLGGFMSDSIVPNAARAMLFAHFKERNFSQRAFVDHICASGRELAAPGQMKKVWNGALDSLQPALLQALLRKPWH